MIKVLIVDDSSTVQEYLAYIFGSDPAFQVIAAARSGAEALKAIQETRPDVITMDIHMPEMDGYEATRLIMQTAPTPIVIVTASASGKEVDSTFRALEAGALAVELRPPGIGHAEHKAAVKHLLDTVRMMSEIKVVRRISRLVKDIPTPPTLITSTHLAGEYQLVAIGTSTGGPPVLHKILSLLPSNLPVPVLIVQHISAGFTEGFVDWLTSASGFPIHIASHDQQLLPGHGYVAPEGFHIGVASGLRIMLSDHAPEDNLRPSVAYLFRTTAQVLGSRAVGVLLTGMGRDGAKELKEMRNRGALTIAQDEASSIVYGMPGEAVQLGAAMFVLPPEAIAATLASLVATNHKAPE